MKSRSVFAMMALVVGCGDDHEIGMLEPNTSPGVVDSGLPDGVDDDAPAVLGPEVSTGTSDVDAGGPYGPPQSWTGYVQDFEFPSGSDAVKLVFATDEQGHMAGRLILGSGTPPPPATNPDVGYPDPRNGVTYNIEGFAYTILDGIYTPGRLRFDYNQREPWGGWCALQTPPLDGSSNCLPEPDQSWVASCDTSTDVCILAPGSDAATTVNSAKLSLCSNAKVCICSAAGCKVRGLDYTHHPTPSFDLAISGSTAMGVSGIGNGLLVLTREP